MDQSNPHWGPETPTGELVRQSQGGDLDAYGLLVMRYEAPVLTLIAQLGGTSEGESFVQEIAMEIFAQAWRDLRQIRNIHDFEHWLLRRAARAAIQSPGIKTRSILAGLSEAERLALRLHFTRGGSWEEIALLLDWSVSDVWANIWNGCRRLAPLGETQ